ncbi:MAG: PA14 domain-containing protein [Capsulimonas sp.]|uniref:PA14 domain-containing protein n=1 Tax=Capsulimonas sp. TaxID=2494211 RepID=UPI003264692B
MGNDKSLIKPFLLALCLNAGVITCIGASDTWKAAQAPAQKPIPPLPTRLIQLEAMPPENSQSDNEDSGKETTISGKSNSALPTLKHHAREARLVQSAQTKKSIKPQTRAPKQMSQNAAADPQSSSWIKAEEKKAEQEANAAHRPDTEQHARLSDAGVPKAAGPRQSIASSPIRTAAQGQGKQDTAGQTPTGTTGRKAFRKPGDGKQTGQAAERRLASVPSPQHTSQDGRTGMEKSGDHGASHAPSSPRGKNTAAHGVGVNPSVARIVQDAGGQGSPRQSGPSNRQTASNRDWNFSTPVRTPQLPTVHEEKNDAIPGALVPKAMRRPVASPKPHAFPLIPASIGSHSARGNLVWPVDKGQKPKRPKINGVGKVDGGGDGSGLLGEYFLGQNFEQPLFKRPDPAINFNWTHKQVDARLPIWNPYSVRWTGKITPRYSETYTFYTASDDGVRLYIDGKLLIDNWSIHPASEDSAQVTLQANHPYPIVVEYYEKNGRSVRLIKLYWESSHQTKEYVPQSCFSYPKTEEDKGQHGY